MTQMFATIDVKKTAVLNCPKESQDMAIAGAVNEFWPGDDHWKATVCKFERDFLGTHLGPFIWVRRRIGKIFGHRPASNRTQNSGTANVKNPFHCPSCH